MAASVLVDTNVLVYAHDPSSPAKHQRALDTLVALADTGLGALPVQALSEFFWTVTRGRRPLLDGREADAQVDRLASAWPVFDLTAAIVREAVRGVRVHRLAYWDAQIWASARMNQVPVVLSEDFSDGRRIEGVRFVDPFREGFTVAELLRR